MQGVYVTMAPPIVVGLCDTSNYALVPIELIQLTQIKWWA